MSYNTKKKRCVVGCFFSFLLMLILMQFFHETLFHCVVIEDIIIYREQLKRWYIILFLLLCIITLVVGNGKESWRWYCGIGIVPALILRAFRILITHKVLFYIISCGFAVYSLLVIIKYVNETLRVGRRKSARYMVSKILRVFLSIIVCVQIGNAGNGNRKEEQPLLKNEIATDFNEFIISYKDEAAYWKRKYYQGLNNEEKKIVYDNYVRMLSVYLGVEAPKIIIEKYDDERARGYYRFGDGEISVSNGIFEGDRNDAASVLAHEMYHLYQHELLDSFDEEVEMIDKKLYAYRSIIRLREGIRTYKKASEDTDAYYNNIVEVEAREFATSKMWNWTDYADSQE